MKNTILLNLINDELKHKAAGRIEFDRKEYRFYPDPSFCHPEWLKAYQVMNNMFELHALLISQEQFYKLKASNKKFSQLISTEKKQPTNFKVAKPVKASATLQQIIKLKKQHLTDKRISELMCVSVYAVEKMLYRARKDLHFHTTGELVKYFGITDEEK